MKNIFLIRTAELRGREMRTEKSKKARQISISKATLKKSAAFPAPSQMICCVPGTARILKGAMSIPFNLKLIKSQTQPDGGEGYSGMATGYLVTVPGKEAALLRQGTANARGDEQEPSQAGLVGRACNTRRSPLSIISQIRILGAHVRKDACPPREICRDVRQWTDRTVRGGDHVAEVSRGHSSLWKRAGPPKNGRSIPGGLTPTKARTVPDRMAWVNDNDK